MGDRIGLGVGIDESGVLAERAMPSASAGGSGTPLALRSGITGASETSWGLKQPQQRVRATLHRRQHVGSLLITGALGIRPGRLGFADVRVRCRQLVAQRARLFPGGLRAPAPRSVTGESDENRYHRADHRHHCLGTDRDRQRSFSMTLSLRRDAATAQTPRTRLREALLDQHRADETS